MVRAALTGRAAVMARTVVMAKAVVRVAATAKVAVMARAGRVPAALTARTGAVHTVRAVARAKVAATEKVVPRANAAAMAKADRVPAALMVKTAVAPTDRDVVRAKAAASVKVAASVKADRAQAVHTTTGSRVQLIQTAKGRVAGRQPEETGPQPVAGRNSRSQIRICSIKIQMRA